MPFPYAGLGVGLRGPFTYDLSAYRGVSFHIRGYLGATSGIRFIVHLPGDTPVGFGSGTCTAGCNDSYQIDVPSFAPLVEHDWEHKVVELSTLRQLGYGTPQPWRPSEVIGLQWGLFSPPLSSEEPYLICVDQVELVR
jgi:hypothetical protein